MKLQVDHPIGIVEEDLDVATGRRRLCHPRIVRSEASQSPCGERLAWDNEGYLAYSTARVSRMTVTLIWPG
jgi:hypothetical protein